MTDESIRVSVSLQAPVGVRSKGKRSKQPSSGDKLLIEYAQGPWNNHTGLRVCDHYAIAVCPEGREMRREGNGFTLALNRDSPNETDTEPAVSRGCHIHGNPHFRGGSTGCRLNTQG